MPELADSESDSDTDEEYAPQATRIPNNPQILTWKLLQHTTKKTTTLPVRVFFFLAGYYACTI